VLCGTEEAIERARRLRKLLGGGMRQAGVLAAAALHALEHHVGRLADDHRNARRLAAGLEKLGVRVDPAPETNMVLFDVPDTMAFLRTTRAREVLVNPTAPGRFRAVTHLDVSEADVDEALARIAEGLAELQA
jgi:threonine aldolase